jgi:hypothetical protein
MSVLVNNTSIKSDSSENYNLFLLDGDSKKNCLLADTEFFLENNARLEPYLKNYFFKKRFSLVAGEF